MHWQESIKYKQYNYEYSQVTITLKLHVARFPEASVNVYDTGVVPRGN